MELGSLVDHPNVVIKSPEHVLEKIARIRQDGADALHVITGTALFSLGLTQIRFRHDFD